MPERRGELFIPSNLSVIVRMHIDPGWGDQQAIGVYDASSMAKVFTDLLGTPFYVARDKDIEGLMRKKGRVVLPEGSFNDLDGRLDRLKSEHRKLGWEIEAWEKEMAGTSHVFQTIQEDQEPKLPEESSDVTPKLRAIIESYGFYKPTDEQEVAATASHA